MIARRLTTFLAAGTIVLAACGGSSDGGDTADPAAGAVGESDSPATAPAVESPADGAAPEPTDAPPDEAAPSETGSTEPRPTETEPSEAPQPAPGPTEAPEPTPAPTEAPAVVPTALDFTARTLDGSEIEMGQYAGRPVLLWFWAPW